MLILLPDSMIPDFMLQLLLSEDILILLIPVDEKSLSLHNVGRTLDDADGRGKVAGARTGSSWVDPIVGKIYLE